VTAQPHISFETATPEPSSSGDAAPFSESPWPAPPTADAFYGLAGRIVRAIGPQTEADPAALLLQALAAFGNAAGSKPHYFVEGARHPGKLFVGIVGTTSKGRKGTSWERIRELFAFTDKDWTQRIVSGLSSGEGLIWEIRDPIDKTKNGRRTGAVGNTLVDEGVSDKRVLAVEPELASTLAAMARPGNTLSAVVRDAWDRTELRTLTKLSPARSTGAHVSVIGHVTRDELRRSLDRTELGNGFANRFLWVAAKRARVLPFGGTPVDLWPLAAELREALRFARETEQVPWAADARPIWEAAYPVLSEGRLGILGAVTARAEAQVVRIALLYALLDRRREIGAAHLNAALAVWNYAFASARWVWGDALGDPTADELLTFLRADEKGRTETEIRDYFGKHRSGVVGRARQTLLEHGLVSVASEPTGGRPAQRWFAIRPATEATKGTAR
jgi:hypothetical protein